MDNATKELLLEFQTYQQKVKNIASFLYEKALEVWKWERENLEAEHDIGYKLKLDATDCVEFYRSGHYSPFVFDEDYSLDEGDYVLFRVYDSWPRGGYEEKEKSIPLYKLLGNNWRKVALKKHLNKLEQDKKDKEETEKESVRKAEEKEYAEYERLKAKFEGEK